MPPAYHHWQDAAWRLLEPLAALMEPGRATLPLVGQASDHNANADRLEAFARPCLLAASWLRSAAGDETDRTRREQVATWFREGLVHGSNPAHRDYFGPNGNYHQNCVEIGLLTIALHIARDWLWDPLSDAEKEQAAHWISSVRACGHHWNNHMYFGVFTLEFLREVGHAHPTDAAVIAYWMTEMEGMYRGQGWLMDGLNEAYDHYNAFAFHYYGLMWSWLYGHTNAERAARWTQWAREFLADYQHVFAASGEHPAFGRSITYRFNAIAPFPLAVLMEACPLPPGRTRRLCTRNLDFFLEKPIYQEQGALSLGWHDPFPEMTELYSCAGSPYWAAKAFGTLLIPPEHPFWNEPEEALPSEESNYAIPMEPAGLIVRGTNGATELLNAGTEISPPNVLRYGAYKWGKFSYRSGRGYLYTPDLDYYPYDAALTATDPGTGHVYGRHYTIPLELADDHMHCLFALGDKVSQFNVQVETLLFWNGDWQLHVHQVHPFQSCTLALGSYALAARDPATLHSRTDFPLPWVRRDDGEGAALQAIAGFRQVREDARLDDEGPRRHIEAPYHRCVVLQQPDVSNATTVAALAWTGQGETPPQPWEIVSTDADQWELTHPEHGSWKPRHTRLPAVNR